jgi:RNA polymerase sigma-70 factor (ECF subfamily)
MTAHERPDALPDGIESGPTLALRTLPADAGAPVDARELVEVEVSRSELPPFDQMFREHAPSVWRILRRLGVQERDAKDVSQEVFLAVHRQYATYNGRCSVRTWLYGFCLRHAWHYARSPRHRREALMESPPEQDTPALQEAEADRRAAIRRLDGVLCTLDEEKRVAFVLYYLEEMPLAEIATLVGSPVQTVYSRCMAARARVEAALQRPHRSRT